MITSMKNTRFRRTLLVALLFAQLPVMAAPAPDQNLQISFETKPNPPRPGENIVDITVLDAAGVAVIDGTVEVRFHMAAMPSMNMPEMSAVFATRHAGRGHYIGTGKLVMGGTWEVTVTVTRDGTRLGRRRFTVNAKG